MCPNGRHYGVRTKKRPAQGGPLEMVDLKARYLWCPLDGAFTVIFTVFVTGLPPFGV
jgi:hypothetical protein